MPADSPHASSNPSPITDALEIALQLLDDIDTDLWVADDTTHLNRNCPRTTHRTPTSFSPEKLTTETKICGACRHHNNDGMLLHYLIRLARTALNKPAYDDLAAFCDLLQHTVRAPQLHALRDVAAQQIVATQRGMYDLDSHTAVAARLQTAADLRRGNPLHQQLNPVLPKRHLSTVVGADDTAPADVLQWHIRQLTATILRHADHRQRLIRELTEEFTWLAHQLRRTVAGKVGLSFVKPAATLIADHHDMQRDALCKYNHDSRQVLCCLLNDIPHRIPADGMTPAVLAALRTPTLAAATRNNWTQPWFCVLPWPVAVAAAHADPTHIAAVERTDNHDHDPEALAAAATHIAAAHNPDDGTPDPHQLVAAARAAVT